MRSSHRRTLQVVKSTASGSVSALALPVETMPGETGLACIRCGACSADRGGLTAASIGIDLPRTSPGLQNPVALKTGQSIELEVPSAMLIALSSVVYLLPVVLMLFFAVSCEKYFAASEGQVAVSAVAGLCLGLGIIVLLGPALRSQISKRLMLHSVTDSQ